MNEFKERQARRYVELHSDPNHDCDTLAIIKNLLDAMDTWRSRYKDEAWLHAGCLSISEGAPGWEDFLDKPFGPNCSVAMRKVAELRRAYELLQENYKQLEKKP